MRNIFRFINQYSTMKRKAEKIKMDEERRSRSFYFAMKTIIFSLFGFGLALLGGWLLSLTFDSILAIFVLVISIGIIAGAVILFIWGLISFFFQLSINKKAWTWVSLIIFIGLFIASFIGFAYFLNM